MRIMFWKRIENKEKQKERTIAGIISSLSKYSPSERDEVLKRVVSYMMPNKRIYKKRGMSKIAA